jgi:hypothetical protein
MEITDRSGWGALPPERPLTPWSVSELDGICQHWFGAPKAAATHAGCPALLRSVQRSHQQGEYADIAYNFGVCPHGTVYELRGWRFQTGANGTSDANQRFIAFVYMAGTGDPLTKKGQAALEALYAEAFDRGVAVKAITHGSITGSACPGPAVKKWLASGAWKPKQRFRFVLTDGEGGRLLESAAAEKKDEAAVLSSFLERAAKQTNRGKLLAALRRDGDTRLTRKKA